MVYTEGSTTAVSGICWGSWTVSSLGKGAAVLQVGNPGSSSAAFELPGRLSRCFDILMLMMVIVAALCLCVLLGWQLLKNCMNHANCITHI